MFVLHVVLVHEA